MDDNILFAEEIITLQNLKREGEYWDFKREWHKNNCDLLHDIICMANNLSGHDGYIIIGIDEKTDYKAVDISNDSNRKNSQNIVDFLSTKKFAGDMRPFAYVETIVLDGKYVDVIVVRSDNNVPYYLQEKYDGVCPNNIYTRVGDTNTPINKSADFNHVEKLWKKRFGIDLAPIDKLKKYLSRTCDWVELYNGNGYYYKYSPEYRIQYREDTTRNGYEYYMFSQTNSNSHWYLTRIYYHQTPIDEKLCILLDGGRLFVVAPDWRGVHPNNSEFFMYHSYIKGSTDWLLSDLLKSNSSEAAFDYDQLLSCVLVFDNNHERTTFEKYASNNYDVKNLQKYAKKIYPIHDFPNSEYKKQLEKSYMNALYLVDMLKEFRALSSN